MKRKLVVFMAIMMAGTMALRAQPGNGFQRPSVEDRVKRVHAKMDSAFHLEATKQAAIDSAFAEAYRASDAKRDEMRASGSTDRDAMMAAMKVINDARDAKLQAILTADQYKTWKEQIEPTMRGGGRGPGGGGGNGGNR